jgi:hypothetical protein
MPIVDGTLQFVALRQQGGIARCHPGRQAGESGPKCARIDTRPGGYLPGNEFMESCVDFNGVDLDPGCHQ